MKSPEISNSNEKSSIVSNAKRLIQIGAFSAAILAGSAQKIEAQNYSQQAGVQTSETKDKTQKEKIPSRQTAEVFKDFPEDIKVAAKKSDEIAIKVKQAEDVLKKTMEEIRTIVDKPNLKLAEYYPIYSKFTKDLLDLEQKTGELIAADRNVVEKAFGPDINLATIALRDNKDIPALHLTPEQTSIVLRWASIGTQNHNLFEISTEFQDLKKKADNKMREFIK